ncbi:MAG: hypothetical protein R3E79_56150 [Caldilineaceae bacterium]
MLRQGKTRFVMLLWVLALAAAQVAVHLQTAYASGALPPSRP